MNTFIKAQRIPVSTRPSDRQPYGATDPLNRFLESGDATTLASYIRAMSDDNAEAVFAIMQGSGK